MKYYRVEGGKRLAGEIELQGAKNAALPILAATVLTEGENCIKNCPDIGDVDSMKEILSGLGCSIKEESHGLVVGAQLKNNHSIPEEHMRTMRSSVFLMGPLLVRWGEVEISAPGGCNIGKRPIDIHLQALESMGAEIQHKDMRIICRANKLRGCEITLPFPSVGATENIMMAAALAEGETTIKNCAREPEIVDLQNFLNSCGGRIKGAGSSTVIIGGVKKLHSTEYRIMPDRIEWGTYLYAAAGTGGELYTPEGRWEDAEVLLESLKKAGCDIRQGDKGIYMRAPKRLSSMGFIDTAPHPGFPTDMQSQTMVIMADASGETVIRERIFENRFGIIKELKKMGANIEICHRNAIIKGIDVLSCAELHAEDLRGGAALVLAALKAEGTSRINNIFHIQRGYSRFDEKLRNLGAYIEVAE